MKIVTINVPETYVEAMQKLVGEDGLYPSRSELIRCAVREFLLKELEIANNIVKLKDRNLNDFGKEMDEDNFVRVPVESKNENNEPVREFKTYKIIKRLEY